MVQEEPVTELDLLASFSSLLLAIEMLLTQETTQWRRLMVDYLIPRLAGRRTR